MTENPRSGFTLIEVLISMVLLGFALMGAQALLTDRLLGTVGRLDSSATAFQLASDRAETIQADPDYYGFGTRYAGTETAIAGFAGYRRLTAVRVGNGVTTITVRVVTPEQTDTVARTVVVGAP